MRAFSEDVDLWRSHRFALRVKVSVDDGTGTFRDLDDLFGSDWIVRVSLSESIDQPVSSADIELSRAKGQISLASLRDDSLANKLTGSTSPLIQIGRRVKIYISMSPEGIDPQVHTMVFHGFIDEVDFGSDPISIQCRDLGGLAQDRFMEIEQVYGYTGLGPMDIWAPAWTHDVTYAIPSTPNGYYYLASGYGTSGASEPTWPTTVGATVSDNGILWTCVGSTGGSSGDYWLTVLFKMEKEWGLYDELNWLDPPPAPPSWWIHSYRQERVPVLDAMRNIAIQVGWDVRMRWSQDWLDYIMTAWQPERAKTVSDFVFGTSDYLDVRSLKLAIQGIRNVVQVIFSDSLALAANGVDALRRTVRVEDGASISKYGRRFCEIAEASTSQVDLETTATLEANAVLSDLSEPTAEQEIECQYLWAVELGDLYEFEPNGVHYSASQKLAVVAFRHELSSGFGRTTITCRGKPSGGHLAWHRRIAHPGVSPAHHGSAPESPVSVSISNYSGRSTVSFVPPSKRWSDAELYVSASIGFVPGPSNLESRGRITTFTVSRSAGTYYGRIILRDEYGGQSAPTAQFVLTPG